jgi:hypothetical protein
MGKRCFGATAWANLLEVYEGSEVLVLIRVGIM